MDCGRVPLVVASLQAVALRTVPREVLRQASLTLRVMEVCDVDGLADRLTELGYSRSSLVEGPGQFALRGGILDVYSPAAPDPVRVEFFGDEVDLMGYFDPVTQRRTESIEEITL